MNREPQPPRSCVSDSSFGRSKGRCISSEQIQRRPTLPYLILVRPSTSQSFLSLVSPSSHVKSASALQQTPVSTSKRAVTSASKAPMCDANDRHAMHVENCLAVIPLSCRFHSAIVCQHSSLFRMWGTCFMQWIGIEQGQSSEAELQVLTELCIRLCGVGKRKEGVV